MADNAKWYVVHTYSGYENTVAASIEKAVENRGLRDLIQEVSIPLETVTEITDNGPKTVERKVFPGYVLVKMVMTDETWHLVRNVRGVTGFVGSGNKPIPLTEAEIASIQAEARRQADEITARYEAQAKREAEEIAARGRRSAEERQAALVLSRAVFAGKEAVEAGERDAAVLKALMSGIIEAEPLARIDYVEVVDGATMQPTDAIGAMALIAMAVYIGNTRLIDNFIFEEGN